MSFLLSLTESAGRTGSSNTLRVVFPPSDRCFICRQLTVRITGYWSCRWASRACVKRTNPPAADTDGAFPFLTVPVCSFDFKAALSFSCGRKHERKSWRPEPETGWSTGAGMLFGFFLAEKQWISYVNSCRLLLLRLLLQLLLLLFNDAALPSVLFICL